MQLTTEQLKKGVTCPTCNKWAKNNRYSFHKALAKVLIYLAQGCRESNDSYGGYIHLEDYLVEKGCKLKGMAGKLALWGLTESPGETYGNWNFKNGRTSGHWRVTKAGYRFLQRKSLIEKHVITYNNKIIGTEGPLMSIGDALQTPFDYETMMNWRG